jgi:hypothetical protein
MTDGPLVGLAALDNLRSEPKLSGYHLLHGARADLLARAGLTGEALLAIDQAIALAPTDSERRQLTRRQAELNPPLRRRRSHTMIETDLRLRDGQSYIRPDLPRPTPLI